MWVGIVAQHDNDRAQALAGELGAALEGQGTSVVLDASTAEALAGGEGWPPAGDDAADGVSIEAMADCDLVVTIGGDGTFLFAARGAGETPIVGVNLGEVGFLTAVAPDEAVDVVTDLAGRLEAGDSIPTRERPRVTCRGPEWTLGPALNEVVVHGPRRGPGAGVDLTVEVDGRPVTSGRADGVLVATPTGSTAYNLSEGGPLVHPDVDALLVTSMAGETGRSPMVVDLEATVRVTVTDAESGVVVGDGRVRQPIDPPVTLELERADAPVRVAGPDRNFFDGLGKLD